MTTQINGHNVDETVTFEYAPNPKRPGFKAHERYAIYSQAESLEEYLILFAEEDGLEKKYAMPDLRYDEEHGHLKLLDAEGKQINVKED